MFVTYPAYIREKALALRGEGMTLDEITARLALPRTTIYTWIKDVPIPESPRRSAARLRASAANSARAAAVREAAYLDGCATFETLCQLDGFRDFVCMYSGEGFKRTRHAVALGNSDPAVVRLAAHWIRLFTRNGVRYYVQYHADQDVAQLRAFWSGQLEFSPEQIRLQRKSNSGRLAGRKWRSPHGVLTVTTGDTIFRARLQGWMDRCRESWLDSITSRGVAQPGRAPVLGTGGFAGSNPATPMV